MTEEEEVAAMEFLYYWGPKTNSHAYFSYVPHGGLWTHIPMVMQDAYDLGLIAIHPVGNMRAFTPTPKGKALLALVGDKP
jgi:hypothetical protein